MLERVSLDGTCLKASAALSITYAVFHTTGDDALRAMAGLAKAMSEMTSNVKIYFVMDPWFGMLDMCVG